MSFKRRRPLTDPPPPDVLAMSWGDVRALPVGELPTLAPWQGPESCPPDDRCPPLPGFPRCAASCAPAPSAEREAQLLSYGAALARALPSALTLDGDGLTGWPPLASQASWWSLAAVHMHGEGRPLPGPGIGLLLLPPPSGWPAGGPGVAWSPCPRSSLGWAAVGSERRPWALRRALRRGRRQAGGGRAGLALLRVLVSPGEVSVAAPLGELPPAGPGQLSAVAIFTPPAPLLDIAGGMPQ